MEGTMKVAVMTGIGQMGFDMRPIPAPGPGEVLVKLEYVGICGSDLHYYETGQIAGKTVELDIFPDAPHAFHADYRPTYRKEAAEAGWKLMLAFFKKHGVA